MLARLRETYPNDVRLIYRHFPLPSHDKARLAAEAAEAAGAQGRFWELHELLYTKHTEWANLSLADFRVRLDQYAAEAELDLKRFAADLDRGAFKDKIEAAYQSAIRIGGAGLPGTPFVIFNDQPYQGPLEYWALDALVKLEKLAERQFAQPEAVIDPLKNYTAILRTEKGDIVIELLVEKAPVTVNNFVFLAQKGWFEGVTFHRVLPGFVAQAGDPTGTGFGGPGYYIANEIAPDLRYDAPGIVGMANAGPDTNGSQFFITLDPAWVNQAGASTSNATPDPEEAKLIQSLRDSQAALNGKYTIFGKVIRGLDVAEKLTPRDASQNPDAPAGDKILTVIIEEK